MTDAGARYLTVTNLRKVYRTGAESVEAVSSVGFSVPKGQFVAILGRSPGNPRDVQILNFYWK